MLVILLLSELSVIFIRFNGLYFSIYVQKIVKTDFFRALSLCLEIGKDIFYRERFFVQKMGTETNFGVKMPFQ